MVLHPAVIGVDPLELPPHTPSVSVAGWGRGGCGVQGGG